MLDYKKSDQTFLHHFNIKKVLNILRVTSEMSRVDLAEVSKLDKKTITNIVKKLLEEKQVEVVSTKIEGSGRPKQLLSLRNDFCYTLGVDIGGTHIAAVILDFVGKTVASVNLKSSHSDDYEKILQKCDTAIGLILEQANLSIEQIEGIGITFPGLIDKEKGSAMVVENLPALKDKNIRAYFLEKYHVPVLLEDCSRMMALTELWNNPNSDYANFIVFDLGLGIGCGIVLNGKIFSGSNGKSGEIGHTIVDVDGPLCTCGRYGCIESLASGWAISKKINTMLKEGECGPLKGMDDSENHEITVKDIVNAANLGDAKCQEQLIDAGKHIGIGVANAILLFNPNKIILGGRMITDNPYLIDAIIETARTQTIHELWKDTEILVSSVGVFASAIGAGLLHLRKYFE